MAEPTPADAEPRQLEPEHVSDVSLVPETLLGLSGAPTNRRNADGTDRTSAWSGSPSVQPPPRVDGYRLLESLGEGGMGIVFKAEHLALRRIVALKMIRSGALASSEELLRFRIEAEAVARLQHPNIVQIFDVGQHEGLRYLSLEFVEGGTLADRISGRPQPPRQAAHVLELLARAVHAAHLQGIVHRDLKPHNVLLTSQGSPKISDFGLAKLLSDHDPAESFMMVGTAGYMAPEQAWGGGPAAEIGPAADVYGLGVILYEMLTGRVPFKGETPRDTLEQVWTKEPPRLKTFQTGVPRDLETICLKCLEKLPHQRYTSAEALADDLKRYLAGEPITARPTSTTERVIKWARRRPAAASLIGLSGAALLVVLSLVTFYQIQVNNNYRLAKANLQQAQNAIDQLINQVSLERLAPIPHSESLRRDLLETALGLCQRLEADNPNDPDLGRQAARARRQMADLYQLLGRSPSAEQSYLAAIDAFAKFERRLPSDPRDTRELATAYNNLANLDERTGNGQRAVERYRQSLSRWDTLNKRSPMTADYQHGLAATLNNLGLALAASDPVESLRFQQQAIERRRQLVQDNPTNTEHRLELAGSLNNLASLRRNAGKHAEAEESLHEGIEQLAALSKDQQDTPTARMTAATTWNNLAAVLMAQARTVAAEEAYRKSLAAFEPLLADFPSVLSYQQGLADTQSNLGLLLATENRPDEAAQVLERAAVNYEALQSESSNLLSAETGLVTAWERLSRIYLAKRETQRAEQTILRATRLGGELVDRYPNNAELAHRQSVALQTMARLLSARQLNGDARRQLDDAARLGQRAVMLRPDTLAYRATLRDCYAQLTPILIELGDADGAVRAADEISRLFPGELEPNLQSAQLLAQCIPLATGLKSAGGKGADGSPLDEYCARRATELLEKLAKQQGKTVAELSSNPAFGPLLERAEFKAVSGK